MAYANTERSGEQGAASLWTPGSQSHKEKTRPEDRVSNYYCLAQRASETLDAGASVFEDRVRRRVGNAEVRSKTECGAVNDSDALSFKQLEREVFVRLDQLARRCGL